MSIDINWEHLTGGDDGARLAESVRAFIHDRFQKVTLPKFIRSVKVHSFDFGSVAPDVEIKDVCDPLPDFYDDDDDEDEGDAPADGDGDSSTTPLHDPAKPDPQHPPHQQQEHQPQPSHLSQSQSQTGPSRPPRPQRPTLDAVQAPQLHHRQSIESTSQPMSPAIPGGTTNFSYFHMPLNPALSGHALQRGGGGGTATPHFHPSWPLMSQSTTTTPSALPGHAIRGSMTHDPLTISPLPEEPAREAASVASDEPAPTDVQIVSHLRYAGDVRLSLTADILLDYPTTSFVGIPLQLNVTGMSFDGVAIVAYIRRRAHFCFLAPDDADALVGGEESGLEDIDGDGEGEDGGARGHGGLRDAGTKSDGNAPRKPVGGLFEEIHVESEIGQREKGKQVLKNVGKVEKFVLEQVRKIFENEFVYPSFWTFLV